MTRKYLVTEGEFLSATVSPEGNLEWTRDNGEVVTAGVVVGPAATDADVAGYVGDPASATGTQLSARIAEARGTVVDTEYASLDDAFAALASGGTIEIRSDHVRTTTFTVDKPCTVRFTDGSLSTADPNLNVIVVAADDVTLVRPRIVGAGVDVNGTGRGIQAWGTLAARVQRITVTRPDIRDFNYGGVWLRLCDDVLVTGGEIQNCGYFGVQILSGTRNRVTRVNIHDIIQPTGYVNSYGIAFTNWDATEPPSTDCLAINCVIERIPWEGIDTHGGANLLFEGNVVNDCGNAIAVVDGPGNIAPKNVQVLNNQISNSTRSAGIVFVGNGVSTAPAVDSATGSIIGNTIRQSGMDGTNKGAIIVYNTRGLVITGNTIIEPAVTGVFVYYNNTDITVVGNMVVDAHSEVVLTQAVLVGQDRNSGICVANTLTRGTLTATRVNEYGLRFSATAVAASFQVGQNKWSAATPVQDAAGAIIRPEITGSRGGNAALGSLLTQLAAAYLVKDSTSA